MLKVSFLELFFRGFPESILFIWAISLINMKKISKKVWLLLSIFLSIIVYMVRLLPIQFGVHTLITVVFLIISTNYFIKLPLTRAISSSLIVITLLSICEFINSVLLIHLFNIDILNLVNIPSKKILIYMPSLVLFAIFILIFNKFNKNIAKGEN
ncbi:hypothetical protein SAMN02745134_02208 [Clostridium acidisoli DSM 12555]|uniref:Uncharacterized protein n=1 Tax=Clostridium acidisoli DSM 12555 TaxID=1121291 RepID=A0A1W1XL60_9CLOT|nr:hypothetical protein SAMN02745134_02208 [Clostridium acidisoli DSM 12555]